MATLTELAAVRGQLLGITQMIQANHDATHQRIEDFRHAVEGRISGVENRVGTLERNERSTAIKAAGFAASTAALISAGFALLKISGH